MKNIKEEECRHCNGTGKILVCPLCKNTGIVSKFTAMDGGGSFVSTNCPNGCKKPIPQFNCRH